MNQLIHYLRYEPLGLGRADPRCAAFLNKKGIFAPKASSCGKFTFREKMTIAL